MGLRVAPRPSPVFGAALALRLWKVVLAVWLTAEAAAAPVRLVVWSAAGDALVALPDGSLPPGELALVLFNRLEPVALMLVWIALAGGAALWGWTVLWQAGVVRWFVLSSRDGVRLSEILSRGLLDWWRWARLGLTSVAVLGAAHAGLAVTWWSANDRMRAAGDDSAVGLWLLLVAAGSLAAVLLVWLTGLRGAWLLGSEGRRSAVLAWLAGLAGSIRQPLRSVWTLVVWIVPAVVAAAAPLWLGWQVEATRGVVPTAAIEAVGGLVAAFCLVGLFASFAPVTGLAGRQDGTRDLRSGTTPASPRALVVWRRGVAVAGGDACATRSAGLYPAMERTAHSEQRTAHS